MHFETLDAELDPCQVSEFRFDRLPAFLSIPGQTLQESFKPGIPQGSFRFSSRHYGTDTFLIVDSTEIDRTLVFLRFAI